MLTQQDRQQIQARQMTLEVVEQQLAIFQRNIPFMSLCRPCIARDGITVLNPSDIDRLIGIFREQMEAGRITKFTPASGAASRMFKALASFLNQIEAIDPDTPINDFPENRPEEKSLQQFFSSIESFAFYHDLEGSLSSQGLDIQELLTARTYKPILQHLLTSHGLNYAQLPKGLLKFHHYPGYSRTPIEEHLIEAAAYTIDTSKTARTHFTVSPEHEDLIRKHLAQVRRDLEETGVRLDITFSQQKLWTDTIAVDLMNQPFRTSDGQLAFRPGGHGALLENLNELQGDIVFIKNIDNVVPDRLKECTYQYKMALGGYLVSVQRKIFDYLEILTSGDVKKNIVEQMYSFASQTLSISIPDAFQGWSPDQQTSFFFQRFHRPLRVCGMVPNTGEPGGGPFWVQEADGSLSLQIVESVQVDPTSSEQQHILKSSTHFNPVDMVCGVRDFRGNLFDLTQFIDPDTGFISVKSYEGRELKALELPGLWNGAMARWNTIFVEIPQITFNPVKTVFDLLRPEHQPA